MTIPPAKPSASKRLALAAALLLAGLVLIGFFGMQAYRNYTRFQQFRRAPGTATAEDLRDWMTLPYIAHLYSVPVDELFAALELPKNGNERLTLQQLAAKYGREPRELRQALQRALRRHQPPPPPAPGGAP